MKQLPQVLFLNHEGFNASCLSCSSITLKAQAKTSGHDLSDLIGMLQHHGSAIPTERLCQPVGKKNAADQAAL